MLMHERQVVPHDCALVVLINLFPDNDFDPALAAKYVRLVNDFVTLALATRFPGHSMDYRADVTRIATPEEALGSRVTLSRYSYFSRFTGASLSVGADARASARETPGRSLATTPSAAVGARGLPLRNGAQKST